MPTELETWKDIQSSPAKCLVAEYKRIGLSLSCSRKCMMIETELKLRLELDQVQPMIDAREAYFTGKDVDGITFDEACDKLIDSFV